VPPSPRDIPTVTTPLTVAPSGGFVKIGRGPGGGGPSAVTCRVAVAVDPVPSRTVRTSVCGPPEPVIQLKLALVAVPEVVKTCVPSSVRVKVIGVPHAPASAILTGTVPFTVASSVGLVMEAVNGAPITQFATLTARDAVPVLPAESRTVAITALEPLLGCLGAGAIEVGRDDVWFV